MVNIAPRYLMTYMARTKPQAHLIATLQPYRILVQVHRLGPFFLADGLFPHAINRTGQSPTTMVMWASMTHSTGKKGRYMPGLHSIFRALTTISLGHAVYLLCRGDGSHMHTCIHTYGWPLMAGYDGVCLPPAEGETDSKTES